jgi:hypothetical protein
MFTCTRAFLVCLLVCLIAMPELTPNKLLADEKFVSLVISKASAMRSENKYVGFALEVAVDNATGKDITARSHFYSAFDGLVLVVTDKNGKTLAQQSNVMHQSPTATLNPYIVKAGTTSEKLGFPIPDFPKEATMVKVRLVGQLPNSDYKRFLSTETIEVEIKAKQ